MKPVDDMTLAELRSEVDRLRDMVRRVRCAIHGIDGVGFTVEVKGGGITGGGGGGRSYWPGGNG